MLRRNAKCEFDRDERLPLALIAALTIACAIAGSFLPPPWNVAVAIAIAGYGVASWGDWKSQILWDEILIGTTLLSATAMIAGGRGSLSLEGGLMCGGVMYALYFAARAFGRETGFGDVKLAFGIGVALGPIPGIAALALGSIGWLIVTLAWAASNRVPFATLRTTAIPFGPGLAIGLVLGAAFVPGLGSI
jgi:prepilin signal peptidase PulO-like enzyme (type II secretory pathway)